MDFFQVAIVILFGLAISDLVVGVSNDAVNFLNSSVGSRVAPRHIIMIIASLGILAGVTFSSGMMEVARKGIFNPQFFTMPELMVVFLAVMLTDIILLDIYNTFGLPTSTTVSIVFELLGAAVAVSFLKVIQSGQSLSQVLDYINSAKALAIIFGILLSVVIAFFAGAIIQFLSRLLFTFDYRRRLYRYGALWGGVALSAIAYFILIKGAKGASFISDATLGWIQGHTGLILLGSFVVSALLLQLLMLLTRVNILKLIVLVGTFALAMAFAANDLVNFIGVPLAGLSAYQEASASPDLLGTTMEALRQPVRSNTAFLLIAGAVMVVTLWVSRKARSVTKTEVRLGRQDEGFERFESTLLSQSVVRVVAALLENTGRMFPSRVRKAVSRRLDRSRYRPKPQPDGTVPAFDLVRAAVNLMVAATLISLATSLKLPLSTTYVTFMVAMGTSLSDQAWGRDSAVYRVSGVLTVIGGWFFTAMMAFTVSSIFAVAIYFGGGIATAVIVALAVLIIARTHRVHRRREEVERAVDVFNLRKIKDAGAAIEITFEHAGIFLREVKSVLETGFGGLFKYDRQQLKIARNDQRKIQRWANIIAANIFKVLRLLQWTHVEHTQRYAQTISTLQEISESVRDVIMRSHVHVANNHAGLLEVQAEELERIHHLLGQILDHTSGALLRRTKPEADFIAARNSELRVLANEFDQNQILRIQENASKTRLSILFYGLMWDCLKIAEQTTNLLNIFQEPLMLREEPGLPDAPTTTERATQSTHQHPPGRREASE
jgi:phosphate/sulfate permease